MLHLIFQSAVVAAEGKITLYLSTQHHLCILQGLIVEQPVQLCPLCRGAAVLVLDCTGIEDALDVTMAQQAELDYLIYNDPLGYADLILNGDPEEYLKNVAGSHGLES